MQEDSLGIAVHNINFSKPGQEQSITQKT